jgi:glycerophosphoryl diester phosphodiesterase
LSTYKHIEIQGHRGARGLFPENTITAFIEAVKLGVDGIEMDVVISKDHQVVVSHEPWMSSLYCTKPNGEAVQKELEETYNLYQMNYTEIAQFDCGIRGNVLFPSQQKIAERKPLLSEVIEAIEAYTTNNQLPPIKYFIEIKTEINGDHLFHPEPETFVTLVYEELKKYNILSRTILMSFDVRILQALKYIKTTVPLSYLIENTDSLDVNLERLGFIPDIYAPEFILINDQLISDLQRKNIRLITWTVNEPEDMKRLMTMGVTTLITDYPNKAINLQNQLP